MPHRKTNMAEEERASVRERNRLSVVVLGIPDINFGLCYMNSYNPDAIYVYFKHP